MPPAIGETTSRRGPVVLPFLLPLPVMPGAFRGIIAVGLHLARDEGRFLRDFLCRTLDARAERASRSGRRG